MIIVLRNKFKDNGHFEWFIYSNVTNIEIGLDNITRIMEDGFRLIKCPNTFYPDEFTYRIYEVFSKYNSEQELKCNFIEEYPELFI